MTAASSVALPEPGAVVGGKYLLERELGRGGMGAVFAARHSRMHNAVAIKVMLADATNHEALTRFMNEARAASNIQSEHVVRVTDVDEEKGYAFMVLELLEGEDLAQVLERERRISPALAVSYAIQAMSGVAQAHAQGIVHRDLKPSNLFLTKRSDGSKVIKVLDFGISKQGASQLSQKPANLTSTKAMLGSPLYMSPEQLRSSKTVDHRADIWAMGVILYELMTGTLPFTGESLGELFAAILETEPVPLTQRVTDGTISPALSALVLRCLARRPEERFQSAGELISALTQHAGGATMNMAHGAGINSPYAMSAVAPASFAVTPGTVNLAPGHRPQSAASISGNHGGPHPGHPSAGQMMHGGPMPPNAANTGSGVHVPVVKATVPLGSVTPQPNDPAFRFTGGTYPGAPPKSPLGLVMGIAAGVIGLVGIVLIVVVLGKKASVPEPIAPTTSPPPPTSTVSTAADPTPPPTAAPSAVPSAMPPPSATASASAAPTQVATVVGPHAKKPPPPTTTAPPPPVTSKPPPPTPTAAKTGDSLGGTR